MKLGVNEGVSARDFNPALNTNIQGEQTDPTFLLTCPLTCTYWSGKSRHVSKKGWSGLVMLVVVARATHTPTSTDHHHLLLDLNSLFKYK